MPKLYDEYTSLQRDVIDRLAEIEASDRNMCEGCGGEDCQCCEIYLDRQKWVSPDELFRDADPYESWHENEQHRMEDEDDLADEFEPHEYEEDDEYDEYDEDDEYDEYDEDEPEEPDSPPANKTKVFPCDTLDADGHYHCPYAKDGESTGMYFCRDMCGVGVDE